MRRGSSSTAAEEAGSKASHDVRGLYDPLLNDTPPKPPSFIRSGRRKVSNQLVADGPDPIAAPTPNADLSITVNLESSSNRKSQDVAPDWLPLSPPSSSGIVFPDDRTGKDISRNQPVQNRCRVGGNELRDQIVWPPYQPYSLSVHEDAIREVNSVDQDWICRVCGCLDVNCLTSNCPYGHIFCYDCLHSWLEKASRCPVCQEEICSDLCTPPQDSIRHKILAVEVTCIYCPITPPWSGPLGMLPKHWRSGCLGPTAECEYFFVGCEYSGLTPLMSQHSYEAHYQHVRLMRNRLEEEELARDKLRERLQKAGLNVESSYQSQNSKNLETPVESPGKLLIFPDDRDEPKSTSISESIWSSKSSVKSGIETYSSELEQVPPILSRKLVFIDPSPLLNGLVQNEITDESLPMFKLSHFNLGSTLISTIKDHMKTLITGQIASTVDGPNMFLVAASQFVLTVHNESAQNRTSCGCIPFAIGRGPKPKILLDEAERSFSLWHLKSITPNFGAGHIESKLLIPLPSPYTERHDGLQLQIVATKNTVQIFAATSASQVVCRLRFARNELGQLDGSKPIEWERLSVLDSLESKEVGIRAIYQHRGAILIALEEVPFESGQYKSPREKMNWQLRSLDFGRRQDGSQQLKIKTKNRKCDPVMEAVLKHNLMMVGFDLRLTTKLLLSFHRPDPEIWHMACASRSMEFPMVQGNELLLLVELAQLEDGDYISKEVVREVLRDRVVIDTFPFDSDKLFVVTIQGGISPKQFKRQARISFYEQFDLWHLCATKSNQRKKQLRPVKNENLKARVLLSYHWSLYLDNGGSYSWTSSTLNLIRSLLKQLAMGMDPRDNTSMLIQDHFLSCDEMEHHDVERLFLCILNPR